jgi:flagellar hook-associated protein 2
MAEVTFGGLATGLSTDEIITKLIAVQRRPIDRLESDKEHEATRLKAYGQLNTRLNDLKKAADAMNISSEVRTSRVSLSSENNLTAAATNASSGSYNIGVAQLAQMQKNVSNGYASKTSGIFGTGSLSINGQAITIDATNNSLQGIMTAINGQSTTTGVNATIINDGSGATPYRLILTGKDASTSFSVTSALTGGLGVELSTTKTQSAQQAVVIIDGTPVISNSNAISDVISGVTLNLNAANVKTYAGTEEVGVDSWKWIDPPQYTQTTLNVADDPSALKEKISTFVSSYNKVMEWINKAYDTKTVAEATADAATSATSTEEDILSDYLRGDSTVNSVKRGLQSILTDTITNSGSLHTLADVGIATNKDGTLTLSSSKLDSAMGTGLDAMVKLLAGEDATNGVMKKFNSYLVDLTSTTKGMYAEKKNRYQTRAERIDTQITLKETSMEKIEKTMRARFTAMELLVSNLNSQSNFLTQQITQLNKSTA